MRTYCPRVAGVVADASWPCSVATTPCPTPDPFAVKISGAAALRFAVITGDRAEPLPDCEVTVIAACDCPANSHGTWKLICDGETKSNGASMPPIVTFVPPRLLVSGTTVALVEPAARL